MLKSSFKYLFCLAVFFSVNRLSPQTENSEKIKSELKQLRAQPDFDPNATRNIDLLIRLGRNLIYINPDTLLTLGSEIRALSTSSNYSEGLVAAEIMQASGYAFMGFLEKAIKKCNKGIALGLEKKKFNFVARAFNLKAISRFKMNNYGAAFTNFQEALRYAKEVNNSSLISEVHMNMATMFSLLNDYDEALSIYKKALEDETGNSDELLRSQILSNMAFVQTNIGDYEDALKNVEASMIYFRKESKPAWFANCLDIKGKISLGRKNYSEALQCFKESKLIHKSIQDNQGLASVLLGFSRAYLGLDQLEKAEQNGLNSLQLYRDINFRTGTLNAYRVLAEITERKKSPDEALLYLKKAQVLSDSILKNDKSSKVSLIRAKALFEEKQNQAKVENLAEIGIQKKYTYILLFILLLTLIFSFLIFKANTKVKKANMRLAEQSKSLEESKALLQEINITKDKFFSIIGHDFRSPIINLKLLLQMAAQDDLTPSELKKALSKVADHTNNIQFTLDNLLAWGKTQMKGFRTVPKHVSMQEVAINTIALLNQQILEKNLQVTSKFEKNHNVLADKNHVDLILRNLLSNAIKFSHANGKISLTGKIEKDQLLVAIQDHGVGFQPEILTHLFETNRHHSTFGTFNEKGTGLGLLFCKEVIEANKGKLWIESEPNSKTIAFFTLPLIIVNCYSDENLELEHPINS